jgi:hypothetical protein
MALQGSLRDFSATEILQLLGTQKKTGCLTMEWNTERAVIFVQEGRVVSTRNPGMQRDDPLLTFLRRVHRLSDEQYRGILTIQKESGRDLEDLLLNGRYLDAEELAGYAERQILDDLMRLVRWENGAYRFDPHNRWPNAPLVHLSTEGALIEAARRGDEQKRFVSVFKDPYQLLGVRDLPDPTEPLSEEERELFGLVDGHHTVQEIVDTAPLSEYEAYEALNRMLESHWIEFAGRRDPGVTAAIPAVRVPRLGVPRRSLARELAFAALVIAAFLGLRFGARFIAPAAARPEVNDVFAVAQLRELRFALDLYHREHGNYPLRVEELVDGHWIAPDQARVPGFILSYRPDRGRQDYHLELQPER